MKNGVDLIADERRRQVEAEGWTAEHDDAHKGCELACAAREYLEVSVEQALSDPVDYYASPGWPWEESWWKPSEDPIRNLVKAGALIAAEIDRLQRLKEVVNA